MTEFTVYSVHGSPFGRAVLATLAEKGASHRLVPLSPAELKAEPHISRHPFGRVPALEHDGFVLYETQAILRHLDRIIPAPRLTPDDSCAAAQMDRAMNVCDWYLFQGVNNVIGLHRVVGPRLFGFKPDETAISAAMPKARIVFNELSRLLGSNRYFAGDAVTLADLHVAPHLDLLSMTPEWTALTASAGNLVAWLQRMNARPSMAATTWERVAALAKAA